MNWLNIFTLVFTLLSFYGSYRFLKYLWNFLFQKKQPKRTFEIKELRDKDNFEGWFYEEAYKDILVKKELKLKYKDGNGKVTERDITTTRFGDTEFGGMIMGYCHMRKANRTFRLDRIIECVDMDTGEYISIKKIPSVLQEAYLNSDTYKKEQELQAQRDYNEQKHAYYNDFMERNKVLLKVLMYIVRCDGSFNKKEKAILKELLESIEGNNGFFDDSFLEKVYINSPLPSIQTFKINVGKILNIDLPFDLLETTNNIIATQKNIHPNEQEVLDYIRTKYLTRGTD